jgi:hypothetical protein
MEGQAQHEADDGLLQVATTACSENGSIFSSSCEAPTPA